LLSCHDECFENSIFEDMEILFGHIKILFGDMKIFIGDIKIFIGYMKINNTMKKNIWRLLGEIILIFSLKSSKEFFKQV
jgi:hypothetical protein